MQRREAAAPAPSRAPVGRSAEATKSETQPRASKCIGMRQASNIMQAVAFAKSIDLPLVAHLTIHWSLTDVGDDADGQLFAKLREGLDKWLNRRGIVFAGAWARERQCRGQSDVVHCHLLFHLPVKYRSGKRLVQVEEAILRLIKRHGRGITDERVIKLVIHENPDGKYLIRVAARRCGTNSGFAKNIAACRASFTASGAA